MHPETAAALHQLRREPGQALATPDIVEGCNAVLAEEGGHRCRQCSQGPCSGDWPGGTLLCVVGGAVRQGRPTPWGRKHLEPCRPQQLRLVCKPGPRQLLPCTPSPLVVQLQRNDFNPARG